MLGSFRRTTRRARIAVLSKVPAPLRVGFVAQRRPSVEGASSAGMQISQDSVRRVVRRFWHCATRAASVTASEAFPISRRRRLQTVHILGEGRISATVTLRRPTQHAWCGFHPKTRLFGSTAAGLRYNCLSRVLAGLVCRFLKMPCVGYYDDYGREPPEQLSLQL